MTSRTEYRINSRDLPWHFPQKNCVVESVVKLLREGHSRNVEYRDRMKSPLMSFPLSGVVQYENLLFSVTVIM